MDGVLVHEEQADPGRGRVHRAAESSRAAVPGAHQQLDLHPARPARPAAAQRHRRSRGVDLDLGAGHGAVPRRPAARAASAYVIGEAGLTTALHDVGYVMTERDPDYVVLGETRTYSFEAITKAIRLIEGGARFIATNPDADRPVRRGAAAGDRLGGGADHQARPGVEPYFIGKPNPLMMRSALNRIDAHSETTVMIGDRMDTDVISGLEAGLRTILVLTGSTRPARSTVPLPADPRRRLDRRPRAADRPARPGPLRSGPPG